MRRRTPDEAGLAAAAASLVGADIEIIDRRGGDQVLVPSAVRINGVEVSIPADSTIKIADIRDDEAVTVTITMFARRITIAAEDNT